MSKTVRFVGIIALVCMIFGLGFVTGSNHPGFQVFAQGQPADADQLFQPFWEAWDIVHQKYVDPIDNDALMQGAIGGMVDALGDQHSAYMDPKTFATLNDDLSGQFQGIGATVRKDTRTGGLLIVETITGSPARSAGLRTGDIIITVDGKDITTLSESEIIGKVRGPAGTSVNLGILRGGETKLKPVTVKRALIQVPNVTTAVFQGNIGYVKLGEFTDKASLEMSNALNKLHADQLNGLILDLRGNPGGGLMTAIDIASDFISSGPILIYRGKPGTDDIVYNSTGKTIAPNVPMVVLIDGGSASASELVSGALHDRGRATLVGTTSFGKGSVQEWDTLSNGGGLRITIAHFYTPIGRKIHEVGLTPDFSIQYDPTLTTQYDPQLNEAIWVLRGQL